MFDILYSKFCAATGLEQCIMIEDGKPYLGG